MAEPIEMPFGMVARVGPRIHVLDGGSESHGKKGRRHGVDMSTLLSPQGMTEIDDDPKNINPL